MRSNFFVCSALFILNSVCRKVKFLITFVLKCAVKCQVSGEQMKAKTRRDEKCSPLASYAITKGKMPSFKIDAAYRCNCAVATTNEATHSLHCICISFFF